MNKNEYILVILMSLVYATFHKAPMSLSPNQKFISTGTFAADTSTTYGNSSAQIWNPLLYNMTYPKSFGVVTVGQIFWSIKDFKVSLLEAYMHFYSKLIQITTSAFSMAIYSKRTTIIQTLSYRYVLFINDYVSVANGRSYLFHNIYINNNVSAATNYSIQLLVETMNITGGVQVHMSFIGFDVNTTTADRAIDLNISGTYLYSSIVQMTVQSKSTIPVYVGFVYFSLYAYNKGYFNRASFAAFSTASINGSSFSITNVSNLYEPTTFLALNTLTVKGNSFVDLKLSFNSPDSFTISTITNANTSFAFTYMMLITYFCNYNNPYLNSNDSMCYDVCPERMYGETNNLSCYSCLTEGCASCSNATTCTRCMQGYYLSSKGSCMLCASNCLSCTSNQSCSSSSSSSSSSNVALIVGIVIAIVVVVSGIIVAVKVYKPCGPPQQNMLPMNSDHINRQSSQAIQPFQEIAIQPPPPINPPALINPQSIIMVEVGVWCERAQQAGVRQQCSFCYQEHSYLRLECSHYFHIKCIAMWSDKDKTCPLCRKVLAESNHILICRLCRLKQKMMNFDDILKAYRENTYEREVLCPQCVTISA